MSKLNLYEIRGGNRTDLEQKKYNIGIGISLGNKWFTIENIVEAVKWASSLTRDVVIVYVADSIHAINIEVRNRISFEKALVKAKKMGNDILREIKKDIDNNLMDYSKKVVYVTWDQIVDEKYKSKLQYLTNLYKTNEEFKISIHSIVKSHIKNETRSFSISDIDRFGQYIIEELPEVLVRVKMAGYDCDAYAYPYDGELTKFVEKLQLGEIFPQIRESVIDTEPKVFLEVR